MSVPIAGALALLAVATPLDLPAMPRPGEGYGAVFTWLRTVNSALSIPDAEFRWMFGGFSIPILLAFELAGVRKGWTVYPFLLPFWIVFGSVAFGVVGGLAATGAHLVLFPVGRVWFALRGRRRARKAVVPGTSASVAAAPSPPTQSLQDALRAAVDAIRAAAMDEGEPPGGGGSAQGRPAEPTWATVRRAVVAALRAATRPRPGEHATTPSSRDGTPGSARRRWPVRRQGTPITNGSDPIPRDSGAVRHAPDPPPRGSAGVRGDTESADPKHRKLRALVHLGRIGVARGEAAVFLERFPASSFGEGAFRLTGVHPRLKPPPARGPGR